MSDDPRWVEPSEKAKEDIDTRFKTKHEIPYADIPVGKSYAIPHGTVSINTVRVSANRAAKRFGKVFKVVDHGEGGIEVHCKCLAEVETVAPAVPEKVLTGTIKDFMIQPIEQPQEKPAWGPGSE